MSYALRVLSTSVLLLAAGASAQEVELYPGAPFGVGKISLSLPPGSDGSYSAYQLRERNKRVFYPAFHKAPAGRILRGLLGVGEGATSNVTVWFLFRGNEPLDFIIDGPVKRQFTARLRRTSERQHQRMLKNWWRQYHGMVRELMKEGDHPPTAYHYLTTMLGRRLGLQDPLLSRIREPDSSETAQTLTLLLGFEGLRHHELRAQSSGRSEWRGTANQPVPPRIAWPALRVQVPQGVEVESLATRVPEECFYVRFGNFTNFLWLQNLMDEYGGDLSSMIRLRGTRLGLTERLEQQLSLEQSSVSQIVGPQVVKDVAFIGRDLYTADGAAFGLLFEANNNLLLATDITKQRGSALARLKDQGATMTTVKIAGRDVSFLSTKDHRVWSYYVADGNFHLVTTSRSIVKRFLETGKGVRRLADTAEFQYARSLMPNKNDYTAFLYFSSRFFQGLISPQYQIELSRRLHSRTGMDLISLAHLAAVNEGYDPKAVEDLIRIGTLPDGVGQHPDGSRFVIQGNELVDTVRGPRGAFTPIPDVEIKGVTSDEAATYLRKAQYYRVNWRQLDPLMVGVRRYALDAKKERLVINALISPFEESKYQWLTNSLGGRIENEVVETPGDIAFLQASLRGGLVAPQVPAHILFLGIRDQHPTSDLRPSGFLQTLQMLQNTPGYLGAWPAPGFLDMLPLGLGRDPDFEGYSRYPLGLWRRQFGRFSTASFDRSVLEQVTPQLNVAKAEKPAHIRVRIGDLSNAQATPWIRNLTFQRAKLASDGNIRLLNMMTQQFGVQPDDALAEVETLMLGKLTCTLGGEYSIAATPGGARRWVSSKSTQQYQPPRDYEAQLLLWFRGLSSHLTKYDDRVVVDATLDLQRNAQDTKTQLPNFLDFFGSNRKEKKPKKTTESGVEEIQPKKDEKSPNRERDFEE